MKLIIKTEAVVAGFLDSGCSVGSDQLLLAQLFVVESVVVAEE